jgi:YD repeat-containing protein
MTGTSRFIALVLISLSSGILHAQAWVEYIDESERFIVNFPGEPEVLDTVYLTELGATMPARSYAVDNPPNHFSLIVVDYTEADRIHRERCEHLTYECDGFEAGTDVRGSIAFAAWNYRSSVDGEITYDAYAQVDGVPGHQLQITNPDRSRTFVAIHLNARRLYILEGTVPDEAPPPGLFQQSLGILDEDGRRIRYSYDENDNRVRIDTSYEWIAPGDPVTGEPDPENR